MVEIRGHQRFAWNDLADALAKWTLWNPAAPGPQQLVGLHECALAEHDTTWTWMQTVHPSLASCFPPLVEQQVLQFVPSDMPLAILPLEQDATHAPGVYAKWTMRVKTANILAAEIWAKQPIGTKRTGQRSLRLDEQSHADGAHVIGVQEARTPQGQFHTVHYKIFASGAKVSRAPLYGCELWIHKTLAVIQHPDGHKVRLGDAQFTVQHADPRRLIVEASVAQLRCAFVVLHAPCQGGKTEDGLPSLEVTRNWWQETTEICRDRVQTPLQWFLIDANASLPEGDGHHFGPVGAEVGTRPGEYFIQFLQELDLVVPSSFADVHQGQNYLDSCNRQTQSERLCCRFSAAATAGYS